MLTDMVSCRMKGTFDLQWRFYTEIIALGQEIISNILGVNTSGFHTDLAVIFANFVIL